MAIFKHTRSTDGKRREVVRLGHPVLRQKALEVPEERFGTRFLRDLGRDLTRTMYEDNGMGLAAPQIAVALRAFVYFVPGDGDEDEVPPQVVVNPRLTLEGEADALGWEGCLSLPGLRGIVPRHPRLVCEGLDVDGAPLRIEAEGLHARVIQHEVDHLDGIVFVDRMQDLSTLMYEEEWDRFADHKHLPVET
ncbi:MAG: peptide deformylase [Thermoanaerobaculaceae bacterium]|nr:peptide deformylase [Thermoanaerobaculaceae bacterium]MDI9623126.1 peptide deformylase [Acidobacteriota bacterium]HPW56567.1 peptide deformylase [Thermoanaerobaculaceae bacterium]